MKPTTDDLMDITTRVRAGLLRHDEPDTVWVGTGNGRTCSACDRSIGASDMELEAEFDFGQTTLRFHADCFLAWHRATARQRFVEI